MCDQIAKDFQSITVFDEESKWMMSGLQGEDTKLFLFNLSPRSVVVPEKHCYAMTAAAGTAEASDEENRSTPDLVTKKPAYLIADACQQKHKNPSGPDRSNQKPAYPIADACQQMHKNPSGHSADKSPAEKKPAANLQQKKRPADNRTQRTKEACSKPAAKEACSKPAAKEACSKPAAAPQELPIVLTTRSWRRSRKPSRQPSNLLWRARLLQQKSRRPTISPTLGQRPTHRPTDSAWFR